MINNSPYVRKPASVTRVMGTVLLALLPGIAAYVWQFGPAILGQLAIATATALACEALMLAVRGKPLRLFLSDLSAVVTAWLIALAVPATIPAWLLVLGVAIAIILAKHLYGGLGQNPFNPAMVAYAVMLVAFPALMSQWPSAQADVLTSATPLDALRTGLRAADATVASVMGQPGVFGAVAGQGWEWVAAGFLAGGVLLVALRIITWHIPVAFLATLALLSGVFWLIDSARYASPLLHLMAGGGMLGAFFILTDPVSAATTRRGKLIYAAGAGLLVYLIRVFGNYPDGVAFATLLMNLCVPLIDMKTQPPVFGHKTPRPKA